MIKVRIDSVSVSLDGYTAGPDQDVDNPMGVGGMGLHQWVLPTRTFQQRVLGEPDGETGIDDDFCARGFANIGAWIIGRNMFGPVRGPWPPVEWRGWWGDEPPYHVPVFVLTHYTRPTVVMEGGTEFRFITSGIHEALDQAREAADGKDVRIGGGANTIQQYLRERLVDEMHIAVAPVILGRGERLFEGVDLRAAGYATVECVASKLATHVVIGRSGA